MYIFIKFFLDLKWRVDRRRIRFKVEIFGLFLKVKREIMWFLINRIIVRMEGRDFLEVEFMGFIDI